VTKIANYKCDLHIAMTFFKVPKGSILVVTKLKTEKMKCYHVNCGEQATFYVKVIK